MGVFIISPNDKGGNFTSLSPKDGGTVRAAVADGVQRLYCSVEGSPQLSCGANKPAILTNTSRR